MAKKAVCRLSVRPPPAYRVVVCRGNGEHYWFVILHRNGKTIACGGVYETKRACMDTARRLVRGKFEAEIEYDDGLD